MTLCCVDLLLDVCYNLLFPLALLLLGITSNHRRCQASASLDVVARPATPPPALGLIPIRCTDTRTALPHPRKERHTQPLASLVFVTRTSRTQHVIGSPPVQTDLSYCARQPLGRARAPAAGRGPAQVSWNDRKAGAGGVAGTLLSQQTRRLKLALTSLPPISEINKSCSFAFLTSPSFTPPSTAHSHSFPALYDRAMLLPSPSSAASAGLALLALGLASSAEAAALARRSSGGLSSSLLSKVKANLASDSTDT